MARKRGGLAGFYDRNKGAIKTIAPIAAGFVPVIGPALGAGIGAAIGGLDREGKSGIGLDLGGAIKGGISGYGGGKMGAGIKNMFTTQMAKRGLAAAPGRLAEASSKMPAMSIRPDALTQTVSGANPYGAIGSFDPTMAAGAAPSTGMLASQMPSVNNVASKMSGKVPSVGAAAGRQAAASQRSVADFLADERAARTPSSIKGKIGSALSSKEGLAFAGNAMQAGANIMGSQAQAAQAAQEYEDQQRRLQAQAEMMALFAPQMAGNLGMTNFMPQGASLRGNSAMSMQDYMDYSGANAQPAGPSQGLMDYIDDRPTQAPSGRSQGLMDYVNDRPINSPSGRSQGLMDYVGSRRGQPAGPSEGLMRYVNSRR